MLFSIDSAVIHVLVVGVPTFIFVIMAFITLMKSGKQAIRNIDFPVHVTCRVCGHSFTVTMEEYTKHVMAIRERRLFKIKPLKEMRKAFCAKCGKETYCNWNNINAFSLKKHIPPLFIAMYVSVFKYMGMAVLWICLCSVLFNIKL